MGNRDSDTRKLLEASAWRVRLAETDADEGEHLEFQDWLAADPRNADAWRQVNGPWRLFGDHSTAPEIIAVRREALSRAEQIGQKRWRGTTWRSSRALQAIAASLLVALGISFLIWQNTRFDVYSTGTNERRIVLLADGSTLSLDAQSEIRVRYSASARDLQLVNGQARFDVAHDAERPFSVVASGRKVIATGTSFNVDMLQAKLLVTLIEGRVVVLPMAARRPVDRKHIEHIELTPGKQLVIAGQEPPTIIDVNVGLATAWQTGLIVFENETLAEAAVRLNRYSKNALIVTDADTANIKISGVFKTGDINGFVDTLTTYFPVRSHVQSDGDIEITQHLN